MTNRMPAPRRPFLSRGSLFATAFGLALLVWLIATNHPRAIAAALQQVGWGLFAVVPIRAVALGLAGIGWWALLRRRIAVRLRICLLLRWIREAINVSLPVAQIGGDMIGGRLLTFWRVPAGLSGAGILTDLFLQLAAQVGFTALGIAVLADSLADPRLIRDLLAGLGVSLLGLAGFYLALRHGLVRLAERLFLRLAQRFRPNPGTAPETGWDLHENLALIYRDRPMLAASSALHMAAWLVGVAEIRVALGFMGQHAGWGECLVLESLGQAVRTADFAIPGVMGVQEGGFLLLGQLYGLAAPFALALSLVKRVPDLALGLPGLLAWLLIERRHAD
jgi:glycosyltransferase 2 family protein